MQEILSCCKVFCYLKSANWRFFAADLKVVYSLIKRESTSKRLDLRLKNLEDDIDIKFMSYLHSQVSQDY